MISQSTSRKWRRPQNRTRLQHESLESRNLMAADILDTGNIIACYTYEHTQESPTPVLTSDWVVSVDIVLAPAIDEEGEGFMSPNDGSRTPHESRRAVTPLEGLMGTVSGHHHQRAMDDSLCRNEN